MGVVKTFSTVGPPPVPTGDLFLDRVEMRIIQRLSEHIDHSRTIEVARGLSIARTDYLLLHEELNGGETHPEHYLSTIFVALHRLSPRTRAKLRHPARTRSEAQAFLEGGRG